MCKGYDGWSREERGTFPETGITEGDWALEGMGVVLSGRGVGGGQGKRSG